MKRILAVLLLFAAFIAYGKQTRHHEQKSSLIELSSGLSENSYSFNFCEIEHEIYFKKNEFSVCEAEKKGICLKSLAKRFKPLIDYENGLKYNHNEKQHKDKRKHPKKWVK